MGKKSKRKGNKQDAAGKAVSESTSSTMPTENKHNYPAPPPGVSCWVCLDDEPDETGKPIVRDCSCRGDSGFAHASCILKYAEEKSKGDLSRSSIEKFIPTWNTCNCCHQNYRGQLSLTMVNGMLSFCEKNYPGDLIKVEALMAKMGAIGNLENDQLTSELYKDADEAGLEIISTIDKMKAQHGSSTPKRLLQIESNAYLCLGQGAGMRDKPEAIKYFEKYRDSSRAIGDEWGVKDAETHIREEKARLGLLPMDIGTLRANYKQVIEEPGGKASPVAIIAGVRLALELHLQNCAIESERLSTEVVATSRRVHGVNHQETKWAESKLQKITERKVLFDSKLYQYIGYADRSKATCTLKCLSTGENITAETKQLILMPGIPVVCHGLMNASHLNGKMGDVRSLDIQSGRYEIHFDEKSLKPCLIKGENVDIILDVTKGK